MLHTQPIGTNEHQVTKQWRQNIKKVKFHVTELSIFMLKGVH